MEINNFDKLKSLLHWENPEDFYYIVIMQRKKDFPDHSQNEDEKVIRCYYIYSEKEFDYKFDEIKDTCQRFYARAYIWLRKRNCQQICMESAKELIRYVQEAIPTRGYRVWNRCCGLFPAPKNTKYWVIDYDSKDLVFMQSLIIRINKRESKFDENVVTVIPTKNGYHIITHPFSLEDIDFLKEEDVKRDSPTLLYYYNETN